MEKTLNRKRTLNDGSRLELEEYVLSDPRELARPLGAREIVIAYYDKNGRERGKTHPAQSKFLSREFFEHLFNNIRTYQDFEVVEKGLEDLAKQTYGVLEQLRPDLDPSNGWEFDVELLRLLEEGRRSK